MPWQSVTEKNSAPNKHRAAVATILTDPSETATRHLQSEAERRMLCPYKVQQ